MYDTILIPTDGSDHAVRAAEHGLSLGALFDATVHVLNVVDVQGQAGAFDVGGVDPEFVDRLEAEGESAVDGVASLVDGDVSLETAVVEGDPEETILTYASDHGADLVAMGTHGRTGVERYVAGSVSEHVLRNAAVPVLTARATAASEGTGAYEEILVPTDGSTAADAAVEHGIAIAEAAGARVHAVNVIDLGDVATSAQSTVPADLLDSLEESGRDAVDGVAERAEAAGLDAATEVVSGEPAHDLLAYAEEAGVDLVTMGTHGRTGLSRFLVGSTTERVVRHADVPVLSVNAGDRGEE